MVGWGRGVGAPQHGVIKPHPLKDTGIAAGLWKLHVQLVLILCKLKPGWEGAASSPSRGQLRPRDERSRRQERRGEVGDLLTTSLSGEPGRDPGSPFLVGVLASFLGNWIFFRSSRSWVTHSSRRLLTAAVGMAQEGMPETTPQPHPRAPSHPSPALTVNVMNVEKLPATDVLHAQDLGQGCGNSKGALEGSGHEALPSYASNSTPKLGSLSPSTWKLSLKPL